jgi:hypothetical protein
LNEITKTGLTADRLFVWFCSLGRNRNFYLELNEYFAMPFGCFIDDDSSSSVVSGYKGKSNEPS